MRRYRKAKPIEQLEWFNQTPERPRRYSSKPTSLMSVIKQLAHSSRVPASQTQPLQMSYQQTPSYQKDNYFRPPNGQQFTPNRSRYNNYSQQFSAPIISKQQSRYRPSYVAKQMAASMGYPLSKDLFSAKRRQQHQLEKSALDKFRQATDRKSSGNSLVVNQTIQNALLDRNQARKKQVKRVRSPSDDVYSFDLPGDSFIHPKKKPTLRERQMDNNANGMENRKRERSIEPPGVEVSIQTDRQKKRTFSINRIEMPQPIAPAPFRNRKTIDQSRSKVVESRVSQLPEGSDLVSIVESRAVQKSKQSLTANRISSQVEQSRPESRRQSQRGNSSKRFPVQEAFNKVQLPSQLPQQSKPKVNQNTTKQTLQPSQNDGKISAASQEFLNKFSQKHGKPSKTLKNSQKSAVKPKTSQPPTPKKEEFNDVEEVDLSQFPSKLVATTPQPRQPSKKQQKQQYSEDKLLDNFYDILEMMQQIGEYRQHSKTFYQTRPVQLRKQYKLCSYFTAHQFYYYSQQSYTILTQRPLKTSFHSFSIQQLQILLKTTEFHQELQRIQENIQDSKKLLQACYKECQSLLPPEQRILLLDGKTNYHRPCLNSLAKQFQTLWTLHRGNPHDQSMTERCIYILQMSLALKGLNGQQVNPIDSQYKEKDPDRYLTANKHILISN